MGPGKGPQFVRGCQILQHYLSTEASMQKGVQESHILQLRLLPHRCAHLQLTDSKAWPEPCFAIKSEGMWISLKSDGKILQPKSHLGVRLWYPVITFSIQSSFSDLTIPPLALLWGRFLSHPALQQRSYLVCGSLCAQAPTHSMQKVSGRGCSHLKINLISQILPCSISLHRRMAVSISEPIE